MRIKLPHLAGGGRHASLGGAGRAFGLAAGAGDHWRNAGAVQGLYRSLPRLGSANSGRDLAQSAAGHQLARLCRLRPRNQPAVASSFPSTAAAMYAIGRERGWSKMTREQFDASSTLGGAFLVGDPEQVAEKILFQHEIFNHNRFLMQMSVGTLPHAQVMKNPSSCLRRAGRAAGAGGSGRSASADARTGLSSGSAGRRPPQGQRTFGSVIVHSAKVTAQQRCYTLRSCSLSCQRRWADSGSIECDATSAGMLPAVRGLTSSSNGAMSLCWTGTPRRSRRAAGWSRRRPASRRPAAGVFCRLSGSMIGWFVLVERGPSPAQFLDAERRARGWCAATRRDAASSRGCRRLPSGGRVERRTARWRVLAWA